MGRLALATLCMWALTLLLFKPLAADDGDTGNIELRRIVVTGTRTEKPLLDAPVRTEVVGRAEIDATHARDLGEALEDLPGLLIRPNQKSGVVAWLQGLDADRVLVVIDGEPVSPSTGSSVDLSQIGSMDIERIEIVKGATSVLYGSSAMGGVINIITRKPSRSSSYQLSVDGGSYGEKNLTAIPVNERRLGANLALRRTTGYLKLNADLRDQDGYTLDPRSFRSEGPSGLKANLDLRLAWTPDDATEIYYKPRYYREVISNNATRFTPGVGDIRYRRNERASRISNTVGIERRLASGGELRGWLLRERWQDITEQDTLAGAGIEQRRSARIHLERAELQWNRPAGERHLLSTGLILSRETLNQYQDRVGQARTTEVDDKRKRSIEAYLQDDIFIAEHWELVPGLRVQNDSDFGFYAAPKLNLMLSPDWLASTVTNLRLGIGRGYRVPNLKERFYVFDHSQLGYMVLGSDTLVPERSDSFQLGLEFARPGRYRAGVQLFHNRISQLIDTKLNPDKSAQAGLLIFDYQNFSRAITRGVEMDVRRKLGPLDLKAGYTLLDSKDLDTGKALRQRPRHQLKLGIDYANHPAGTRVTLRGIYQSAEFIGADNRQRSPAWATWDIKLTQQIAQGLSLFTGIDNLGDLHRNPNLGSDFRPATGRFIYLGLRFDG